MYRHINIKDQAEDAASACPLSFLFALVSLLLFIRILRTSTLSLCSRILGAFSLKFDRNSATNVSSGTTRTIPVQCVSTAGREYRSNKKYAILPLWLLCRRKTWSIANKRMPQFVFPIFISMHNVLFSTTTNFINYLFPLNIPVMPFPLVLFMN